MSVSSSRKARVELVAENRMGPGLKDSERQLRMFARSAHSTMGKVGAAAGGLAKSIGFGMASLAGFDLAGGIGGIATDLFDFEKKLVRFQIAARKTPGAMVEMRQAMLDTSSETGMAKDQVLAGAQAYLDLAGAAATTPGIMRTIARASQATGTDVHAMATMVYSLGDAMHIPPGEMESTLSGINNQAKDGSAHFKNMAGEMIGMLPKFAQFGVTGRKGAIGMTALFQTIAGGSKNAEETATIINGMFMGMKRHADRFRASGVEVFNFGKDGTARLKPFEEIISQISKSELMKHPDLLAKAFGRGDGEYGDQILATHVDKIKELIAAGEDATSVTEDLKAVLESPTGKIEAAWNRAKNAIAAALTPERAEAFADAAVKAAEAAARIVEALSSVQKATHDVGEGAAKGGLGASFFWGALGLNSAVTALGGGQSEEDRIADLQANRMKERLAHFEGKSPAFAAAAVAREDSLNKDVNENMNRSFAGPLAPGQTSVKGNAGAFEIGELINLRRHVSGSDAASTAQYLDRAIQQAILAQLRKMTDRLSSVGAATRGPSTGVLQNAIMHASDNAPDLARRVPR